MDPAPAALPFATTTDGTAAATRHVALVHRFIEEGLNAGRLDPVVTELFAPDYVGRLNGDPPRGTGPDQPRLVAESLLAQFPDLHVVMREAVAAGDRVAARFEITSTHVRTRVAVTTHALWLLRVTNGQFSEGWLAYDSAPLLRAAEGAAPG